MISAAKIQARLIKLKSICLTLPETSCVEKGDHLIFFVRKKVFAYYLNNHHGDQIVSICCKTLSGDNQRLIEADPEKFYPPAYIGPRGWVGLRLDLARMDWGEVKELLRGSYAVTAPKKLANLL
jgi:hypothetical protein